MGSGTDYPPGSASARRGRLGDGAPEAIRQDDVEPTGYHGGRGGNLRQSTARVRLAHTPTARWNRSSRRHWPFPTRGPLRPSRRRSMSASSTTRPTRVPARARVALYTQRVSPSVAVREGRSPRDQRLAPSPVSPAKRSRTSLKRLGHAVEPRSAVAAFSLSFLSLELPTHPSQREVDSPWHLPHPSCPLRWLIRRERGELGEGVSRRD